MHPLHKASLVFAFITASYTSVALAGEVPALKITPQPGKTACQSTAKQFGESMAEIELCVTAGSFSHDTYILNIDKKAVLKGIDDETTKGLSSTYQGEKISLICIPQNEAPKDVSAEKIAAYQKMMNISAEDAKRMVILAETVETGRFCTAHAGSVTLIEVQVIFE